MLDERALATVTNYDELIEALRARVAELGITNATLEVITGLPDGYVAKVLGAGRTRNLGALSFGLIFQGLGLRFAVFEDAAATEKMRPRWTQRKKAPPLVAMARIPPRATWLFTPRSGRKAAKARAEKLSPDMRRAIGLNAIQVRWGRHRAKKRLRAQGAKQQAGACA